MNLTKADRDKLRDTQHMHNELRVIGSIIEHKTQNPRDYKQASPSPAPLSKLNITYVSRYMSAPQPALTSIVEDNEPDLPISRKDIQSNVWLNMDQVEPDKLEWMTDKAEKAHQDNLKGTTRFDKDGKAILEQDKHTEGHDILDLTKLLDSTYHPQITFGLNVISKIASLATVGYYDGAFDENIHQILIHNFLLRVRHHLDSPNETICQSALKCLRCLICNNHVDEVLLDRMHPVICESLESVCWLDPGFPGGFEDDMKDSECVKIDAIMALLYRTDILNRLLHLLKTKREFKFTYLDQILDILIRVARHSPAASCFLHLGGCFLPLLIKTLPINIMQEKREVQSIAGKIIKLVRLMTHATILINTESRTPLEYELYDNSKVPLTVMPILESYFYIDCLSLPTEKYDLILKLHIETLRLLKVLCRFTQFIGRIKDLLTMNRDQTLRHLSALAHLRATKYMDSKISFDWQYYAHLIDLLGYFMRHEKTHLRNPFSDSVWGTCVKPLLLGWMRDLAQNNVVPHLDVSIAIAATMNHYRFCSADRSYDELRKIMIEPIIQQHSHNNSRGLNIFKILASRAMERSQLSEYLKCSGKLRDPECLPSFGCLNFNPSSTYQFKLNPVLDHDSPFILLNVFITQLQQEVNYNKESLRYFIDSVHLTRYLRSMAGYHKNPSSYERMVQETFGAQYEIQTLANALVLLSDYYLILNKVDEREVEREHPRDNFEPAELRKSRVECYSNLLYYTISIVGLIDPISQAMSSLKDKIFGRVLFNPELHRRTAAEIQATFDRYTDHSIARHKALSSSVYTLGTFPVDYVNVLEPLYMNSLHTSRFWIYVPLIEFVKAQSKSPKWFKENMTSRYRTGELITFEDTTIISVILLFGATMVRSSPCYCKFVIQPDLDNYLCLLAHVFLHDDLFLDNEVSNATRYHLDMMLRNCLDKANPPFQDASRVIESLGLPIKEIFNKLIDQFEGVSYGDLVFSNFLCLFLTNKSDKYFRKKLFQEKVETCLSQLRLAPEDLWIPEELFFGQRETDEELVGLIGRSRAYLIKNSFIDSFREYHS